MPEDQTIHLYCLCWNDARMLPHFFRHYDRLVDRYFVFDNGSTDQSIPMLQGHGKVELSHFEVTGDSFVAEESHLADTVWQGSEADWVIVTDIDEHLYHPDSLGYLRRCKDRNITAIRSIGYEMVSGYFPAGPERLFESVTTGRRSAGHDRLCIFDPRALTATNFGPGRHVARPEGRVVWPDYPEILLLHYKNLGVDYLIARSAELKLGLRPRDIAQGWGFHYSWSAEQITAAWRKAKDASGPVPGLGALKHIEPAKYFEEEYVIGCSGLMDEAWYLSENPDVRAAGSAPLPHFCIHGWKEGRNPNFYFDPTWYRANYPDHQSGARNPLYDYIVRGEKADAWPSPRFNTGWYRAQHGLTYEESPLRHYLQRRKSGLVSPLPEFDVTAYYQRHPYLLADAWDPFESHFRRAVQKQPAQPPPAVTR